MRDKLKVAGSLAAGVIIGAAAVVGLESLAVVNLTTPVVDDRGHSNVLATEVCLTKTQLDGFVDVAIYGLSGGALVDSTRSNIRVVYPDWQSGATGDPLLFEMSGYLVDVQGRAHSCALSRAALESSWATIFTQAESVVNNCLN